MISAARLRRHPLTWEYGQAERFCPPPPAGALPAEWRAKLGGQRFDPPAVTVVQDAELAGPNLAGFKDNDLLLSVGYYGRLDLWERNYPYFEMAMLARRTPAAELDCAFSMAGVWSGNYFHWLLDHLPTLAAYFEYEARTGETPVILLDHGAPQFARDGLDQLGLAYRVDDCHHYRVRRLVVPTWPRRDGCLRPSAVQFLQARFRQPAWGGGRRLYITRRNAATRRVVNEDELTMALGLEVVEMERLSFAAQARLAAQAELIVGPHGAGLVNAVLGYAPRVVELATPAYANPCCWLAGAAAGCDYRLVMGAPRGVEDMEIDVEKAREAIERA
jgi:capsular polysaccharide biosynthesis protein